MARNKLVKIAGTCIVLALCLSIVGIPLAMMIEMQRTQLVELEQINDKLSK